MALANLAWMLAGIGKHVLVLDWDLEAPGLHRYFYPFLVDKDLTSSDGIIDFVINYATAAASGSDANSVGQTVVDKNWYRPFANILRYASSLKWEFPNDGTLDFIPSGRQGPSYATRVNSFNWQNFYSRLNGGALFEAAKDKMREEYDYILIDSRTGVSDTSGICTVQMPDALVICFTLNNQSIDGAAAVANSVFQQRKDLGEKIFPVPMRIEYTETPKLSLRWDLCKSRFNLFPLSVPEKEKDEYWKQVQIPYVPYYAYEEILASFGDKPGGPGILHDRFASLIKYITGETIQASSITDESVRLHILSIFEGKIAPLDPALEQAKLAETLFLGLSPETQNFAKFLLTRLVLLGPKPDQDTRARVKVRMLGGADPARLEDLISAGLVTRETDSDGDQVLQISRESFCTRWSRLKDWVQNDRDFLTWRQELHVGVAKWEASRRDQDSLLQGPSLTEASSWLQARQADLTENDVQYIQSSLDLLKRSREREQQYVTVQKDYEAVQASYSDVQAALAKRKRWAMVGTIATVALLVAVIGSFSWYNKRQASLDDSRKLAVQANSQLYNDPQLGLLLAVEALKAGDSDEARAAVKQLLPASHLRETTQAHAGAVYTASFSNDSHLVVSAGEDGKVQLYELVGIALRPLESVEHCGRIYGSSFVSNGTVLIAAADGTAEMWNPSAKKITTIYSGPLTQAHFNRQANLIVTANTDGTARVWRADDGRMVSVLVGHTDVVTNASFNRSGTRIVTVSADGTARLWDVRGQLLRTMVPEGRLSFNVPHPVLPGGAMIQPAMIALKRARAVLLSAQFSHDGRSIASASQDGSIYLWSEDGNPLARILLSNDTYASLTGAGFSPNDKFLVATSQDGSVGVWETKTWRLVFHKQISQLSLNSAAFSPDSKLLVTSGDESTLSVLDTSSGEVRAVLRGHHGPVNSADFSSDGKQVITAGSDGTVRIWNTEPLTVLQNPSREQLITLGTAVGWRQLTPAERAKYLNRSGLNSPTKTVQNVSASNSNSILRICKTVLYSGASSENGLIFAKPLIVSGLFGSLPPDLLVAKYGSYPEFLIESSSLSFSGSSKNIAGSGGYLHVGDEPRLHNLACPTEGYAQGSFGAKPNDLVCIRTRDGKHYAAIRVIDAFDDRIAFEWMYQPDGSREFKVQ